MTTRIEMGRAVHREGQTVEEVLRTGWTDYRRQADIENTSRA